MGVSAVDGAVLLAVLVVVVVLDAADYIAEHVAGRGRDVELLAVVADGAGQGVDLGAQLLVEHILSHAGDSSR